MKEALVALNRLVEQGVIDRYAIGGAVAAFYYLEPAVTVDVDAFVSFSSTSLLISLDPIYAALRQMGYDQFIHEGVLVGDWPIQVIVPGNHLVEEALRQSVPADFEGVATQIFTAEHLAAICLQLGRGKDRERLLQFIQEGVLDQTRLDPILDRFGLRSAWEAFLNSMRLQS